MTVMESNAGLRPYIAPEPEKVMGWMDRLGRIHQTREAALAANFDADLRQAVADCYREHDTIFDVLIALAREYPDMLRVLVGDRTYT